MAQQLHTVIIDRTYRNMIHKHGAGRGKLYSHITLITILTASSTVPVDDATHALRATRGS